MHQPKQLQSVVHFYETHPISEYEILEKLRADGIELEGLTEEILKDYDEDHFGGLEAVDVLAEKAGITSGTRVLDVCSGMGGPARYLVHRLGCRVTGLDITPSRHESAMRLTRLVGLDQLVDFRLDNALDMPFADAAFDVVIGQEAFAHVPDKPRLIAECARVVKPGGIVAFTDILRQGRLERGRARAPAPRHDLSVAGNAGRLRPAARRARLHGARLRRPQRVVDRGPETEARDVWLAGGHDRRPVRPCALSPVGRDLRLLRLFAAGRLGGGRFVARRGH
jgi:SAM-dependent methyltransferase